MAKRKTISKNGRWLDHTLRLLERALRVINQQQEQLHQLYELQMNSTPRAKGAIEILPPKIVSNN